jgi:desulfoferrodoxin (superoxide reductase-like protein)
MDSLRCWKGEKMVLQMTVYIYGFSLMETNVGEGEHQMTENHVYSWIHLFFAETLSHEI